MHCSTLLASLAATLVAAQYGDSGSGSGSSSSSASVAPSSTASAAPETFTSTAGTVTHQIAAGLNGQIGYTPNSVTAAVGDVIEFHFYAPEHSVNQATFDKPCAPANGTGFSSGAIITSSGVNAKVFSIKVNDTNPIWFYCGVPTHCQLGMTGVINPPASGPNTLAAFNKAAAGTSTTTAVASEQGGILGAAAVPSGSPTTSAAPSKSAKPNSASSINAWMGVAIGSISLAFAGLML